MIRAIKSHISLVILLIGSFGNAFAEAVPDTNQQQEYELTHMKHLLTHKPEEKGTVGTLLFRNVNNRIYVLLGREHIHNKDRTIAGHFSPLGGSTQSEISYLDNMRKELNEESMGLINLTADHILNNSSFLVTRQKSRKSSENRMIIFALVPAGENYYIPAASLNDLRHTQHASLTSQEAQKDLFAWLDLEEIIAGAAKRATIITTHDIDGNVHKIKLTKYFTQDFLKHRDIKLVLNKLKTK